MAEIVKFPDISKNFKNDVLAAARKYLEKHNLSKEDSERILKEFEGICEAMNLKYNFQLEIDGLDLTEFQAEKIKEVFIDNFENILEQFKDNSIEFSVTVLQLLMRVYAAESD